MIYRYNGPLTGVTLATDKGPREVLLAPGSEVDLPEAHPYVALLLALEPCPLSPCAPPASPQVPQDAPQDKKGR